MGKEFTHFDREGNAVMVDVSEKPVSSVLHSPGGRFQ